MDNTTWDNLMPFVVILVFLCGIALGSFVMHNEVYRTAIKHGAVYHHPITGEYVWKTNKLEKE